MLRLADQGVEVIVDAKQELGVAIAFTSEIDGMIFQGVEIRCIRNKGRSLMKVIDYWSDVVDELEVGGLG